MATAPSPAPAAKTAPPPTTIPTSLPLQATSPVRLSPQAPWFLSAERRLSLRASSPATDPDPDPVPTPAASTPARSLSLDSIDSEVVLDSAPPPLHRPMGGPMPCLGLAQPRPTDDSLVLTGPKRGLMVCDAIFFEIDLKVKDVHGIKVKDERLSKGLMEVDGVMRLAYPTMRKVQTEKLVSMHSILDLSYIFVRNAVEGTVEVRILDRPADFHGKIYARTTNVPCDIMLHDTKVNGMLTAGDGVVQMARSVVGVSVDELLQLTVAAALGGDKFSDHPVQFTPRRNSYDVEEITCGNYKILLKVTWSIVCF